MERRQNTHNSGVSVTAWTESNPGPPPLNPSRHVGSETPYGRTKMNVFGLDRSAFSIGLRARCIDLHRIGSWWASYVFHPIVRITSARLHRTCFEEHRGFHPEARETALGKWRSARQQWSLGSTRALSMYGKRPISQGRERV